MSTSQLKPSRRHMLKTSLMSFAGINAFRATTIGTSDQAAFPSSTTCSTAFSESSAQTVVQSQTAQIAVTLDLEMSANFPNWEDTHWNFEKGNLDAATKEYATEAARRVAASGGKIHFFCVGRVLEQTDVTWLVNLAKQGHPIGNHTYDHVNVMATNLKDLQHRFRLAPWLIQGMSPDQVIRENIRLTKSGLKQRIGINEQGFRTPGGFPKGLVDRPDIQALLYEAGFKWISSKYPTHQYGTAGLRPTNEVLQRIVQAQTEAQPFFYPNGLLEIPMSPISDIGAFRTGKWQLDWFLEAIQRSIEWVITKQAVFDFLAHPSCMVVTDPEFKAIDLICSLVRQNRSKAQLVTLDQIAASRHSEQ